MLSPEDWNRWACAQGSGWASCLGTQWNTQWYVELLLHQVIDILIVFGQATYAIFKLGAILVSYHARGKQHPI
jgi:hypothetical protein